MDNTNDIRYLAEIFRCAIEKYKSIANPRTILLRSFPKGNCTLASSLLQRFLYEKGIYTYLVNGIAGYGEKGESHAWLITEDEIVIDITGDQYKNRTNEFKYEIPVFVGPKDAFHKLFIIDLKEPYTAPNTNPVDLSVEQKNQADYEEIIRIIEDEYEC